MNVKKVFRAAFAAAGLAVLGAVSMSFVPAGEGTDSRVVEEGGTGPYKAIMKEDGIIVSKEYVKGRQNVYSSPAATEYNRTTDSANKTAATLMRILKTFNVAENDADEDPLMRAINGGDEE